MAIRCAMLFHVWHYEWPEIMSKVGREGLLKTPKVTRQRVAQLVARGTDFLVSRGVFAAVTPES